MKLAAAFTSLRAGSATAPRLPMRLPSPGVGGSLRHAFKIAAVVMLAVCGCDSDPIGADTNGRIRGTVTDNAGAAVANAEVAVTVTAPESTPLIYVLRNDLGLRGPRFGCGLAQCGACTVIIDGIAMRSCIVTAEQASGEDVDGQPVLLPMQTGAIQGFEYINPSDDFFDFFQDEVDDGLHHDRPGHAVPLGGLEAILPCGLSGCFIKAVAHGLQDRDVGDRSIRLDSNTHLDLRGETLASSLGRILWSGGLQEAWWSGECWRGRWRLVFLFDPSSVLRVQGAERRLREPQADKNAHEQPHGHIDP